MDLSSELIDRITRTVMSELARQGKGDCTSTSGERILVAGDPAVLGAEGFGGFSLCRIEPCKPVEGEITGCRCVIVTQLSHAELGELGLARGGAGVSGTVLDALLAGVPVYLLPEALLFRKWKKTAPQKLYEVLEGYVRQIEGYGVRIYSLDQIRRDLTGTNSGNYPDKLGVHKEPRRPVITEADAREFIKKGVEVLRLTKGSIVTPLALDVLNGAKIPVEYDRETNYMKSR